VDLPEDRIGCRACFHNPGARIPRHCDDVDVITLQVFGTREWRIERNTDPPVGLKDAVRVSCSRRSGWDAAFTRESFALAMVPGSALYLPRGWWHETRSRSASFSVILSLRRSPRRRPS
jgi:ribosomal protein L16 Arg81 hydroxylase